MVDIIYHLQLTCPARILVYLVNIQIDVWERLGETIILPQRLVKTDTLPTSKKLKAIVINIFGIKTLCRIIKAIHLIKKPSRL